MKINYRLEIEYQVFEEKGKTFFETKSYVFNSENSIQNRKNSINKHASFRHVFELALKTTNYIKLSVTEVINKNEKGYKIPFMNIYYSTEEFTSKNTGTVLFGGYLNLFNERITELEQERKLYEKLEINGLKTEVFEDYKGHTYKVINNSPFTEEDFCILKCSFESKYFVDV
ncbi:MAG: hypothetical protein L3J09_10475 [Flavobacteriaceae bacterium]|nr:hypothetical protein [Flavobacteriaceae bacterium]